MNMHNYLKQNIPEPLYLRLWSFYSLRKKTLSQVGQDFWVFKEVFDGKHDGYFIDIGAADGISDSNTFLLEKRYHWRGLCVEANPSLFETLKRIRNATCLIQ